MQRPPCTQRSALARYGTAILGVAAAIAVRAALHPTLGIRLPFLLFFLAVVPIAWRLGVGPSLVAIVLATTAALTLFMAPIRGFGLATVVDLIGVFLFIAVNLAIVCSAELSRVARCRLEGEVQERVRAEAIILEQMHRAEFGRDVDLALASAPSLAAVLDRCVALTVRHLGGDRAVISLLPAGDAAGPDRPAADADADATGGPDLERGLIGRIAAERRPLLTNRLPDDSGVGDGDWATRAGMLALAGCPLVVEDRLIGVWLLFSRTPLAVATLRTLESAATSLALGIERTRAAEALRAAKREAEDANQAKDRFIAILSHELRTPLNPISLTINAILDRTAPGDELRPDLELIRHYIGLEARLIDDLLDVMRIARGKMPLHRAPVDAHDLIRQAVAICDQDLRGKQLRLDLDLAAPRSSIDADANRICQVCWNLIKNAVKFTPSRGAIAIRTRNVPADAPGPGPGPGRPAGDVGPADDLVIEVADTGVGIEPEVLPRIFAAFQQGDSATVRRFGGLGLGLAICQGIVEGHGGTIAATSAGRDQGTTLTVRLRALPAATRPSTSPTPEFSAGSPRPAATRFARDEPAPAPPSPPAPPPADPAALQVLVVEDEPATVRLMSRLLRGLGYQVTAAETVAEAAAHVAGPRPIDLVVSDIGLPDGTGLDLMRQIRAARGDLPAIALTGFGTEEDIEQSRQAGFAAHMTKPIDFTHLEALIRQVVGPPAA